ncbi:hypothetical protein GX51_02853 [Blastomyces parvus]|uniref:Uncharacterized protein n=1 Tax=Blastomyces parvus TaxID=2060905 RepID=A0A2B7XA93_9EURO|nr:hypothetical protein GX51_02853 [Blastomyces parvus]
MNTDNVEYPFKADLQRVIELIGRIYVSMLELCCKGFGGVKVLCQALSINTESVNRDLQARLSPRGCSPTLPSWVSIISMRQARSSDRQDVAVQDQGLCLSIEQPTKKRPICEWSQNRVARLGSQRATLHCH